LRTLSPGDLHSFPTRRSSDLGAWERFEQKRKRKRRFIIWYRAGGIAALISLIILAVLFQNELLPGASQERVISRKAVEKDALEQDRKSTRLNSSHVKISYAVF